MRKEAIILSVLLTFSTTVFSNWTKLDKASNVDQNGIVMLNFQQGNYTITAIHAIEEKGNKILVFPNPTTDIINIKINEVPRGGINASVFNINGKIKAQKEGEKDQIELSLDLSSLEAGNYLLKVATNKGEHLQTFQIVKH